MCVEERHALSPPPPAVAPSVSHGTQSDLAREIDDAERLGTWTEVRNRWQGQRLRWTVTRQEVLCRSVDQCNVAAFAIERPAKHGWMPALQLSSDELARLEKKCSTQAQCEFTVEGTLRELVVTSDRPTSMKFTDVSVI